jgi:iron complex transport system substrate-binding protein
MHTHTPRLGAACGVLALACVATSLACGRNVPPTTGVAAFVDDFGDTVRVGAASRIVSLNPVTTELLVVAGYRDRVVGRTHWDLYPAAAAGIPDLGNGMGPNVEAVLATRPDLVILYGSSGNRRAALSLQAAGVRTVAVRTDRIADLGRFAAAFAAITGDSALVHAADTALATVDSVRRLPAPARRMRVVWRMGEPPLFVAGRGSFMGELIEVAGAENAFGDVDVPSPQVSVEEVARRDPDIVLVGPQGARTVDSIPAWRAVRAVQRGALAVYDTALVGRPGVRIGEAAVHIRRLLSPGAK